MSYRQRALVALALTGALVVPGFFAAGDARAKSTKSSTKSEAGSKKGEGYLGVNLQDLSEGLADTYDYKGSGVVVSNVVPGSPADEVGVEEGDIITRFNQTPVNSVDQLTERVRALKPGSLADITVWRNGSVHELGRAEIADVADAPTYAPRAPRAPRTPRAFHWNSMPKGKQSFRMISPGRGRLGVETRDLDADLGSYFGAPDGKGVLVLKVIDDTPAERAGLKAGDVILSVDGKSVADGEDLRRELRAQGEGDVDLHIRRKGSERTIKARLEKSELGMWDANGNDWMGWNNDDGDGDARVFRFRGPHGNGMWMGDGGDFHMEGLSDEDQAKLKKDLEKLREDLRQMRNDRDDDDDD